MKDDENIYELFGRFYDADEASDAAGDIEVGDEIFAANPVDGPSEEVLNDIKGQIARRLPAAHRAESVRRVANRFAMAAVILMIAALLFVGHFNRPREMPTAAIIPDAIWESSNLGEDDLDLAMYVSEIEEIESEIRTVRLDEFFNENGIEAVELEMELDDIDSDFWKG